MEAVERVFVGHNERTKIKVFIIYVHIYTYKEG